MALSKSIEIPVNIGKILSDKLNVPSTLTLEEVYLKITNVEGSKRRIIIDLQGEYNNEIVYSNRFTLTPSITDDASNFIKQGYEYLKTLDEFKDAIDC